MRIILFKKKDAFNDIMENHERKVTVVSDFILNSVKKIDIRKTLIKEKLKKKSFCGNLLIK